MDGGFTIGLLSSWFGGIYFGEILGGISRVTAECGGRLLAIQTCDAGTVAVDLTKPPEFRRPVAWNRVSGLAVIHNAVDGQYLAAAKASGKPVVMISDTVPGFACPIVLPDNRPGVREAVTHLIGHGHRRIGFVGNPVQRDLRERYETYLETLAAHGIEPLFFDTGNNQVSGGERAARAMVDAGLPLTAAVTGNDLNALGLARELRAAGYEVPRDLAIVGFDDIDDAAFHQPSLSTVRQRVDAVGALAARLLIRAIEGEELAAESHYVKTEFVARESCGCPSTLKLSAAGPDLPAIRTRDDMSRHLALALGSRDRSAVVDAELLASGVNAIIESLRAAARDEAGPELPAILAALTQIFQSCPSPENLVAAARCVRRVGERITVTEAIGEAGRRRVEERIQELMLTLAMAQASVQFSEIARSRSSFFTHHHVSMDLLRSHEEDPRFLAWLARQPRVRGGCIGLWPPDEIPDQNEPPLELFGLFPRGETAPTPAEPTRCLVADFPPAELIELLDGTAGDMVFLVPMKVNASDQGILAVVGPIDARMATGRENANQWAAMLTIALDHKAVLDSLHTQRELLRHAAMYDELTGLPNRTYFLDRVNGAIGVAARHPSFRFAVLLLDLDGFKVINDSLGHHTGDRLLVQVARRLQGALRQIDVAARLGGDEFAILLNGIDSSENPNAVATRLQAALANPFSLDDQEVVLGASVGIALSTDGYHHAEEIIRNADIAMYSAKSREKGSHAEFDAAMHTRALDRLRTEAGLRQAIDRGELEMHYQPIVNLATGRIRGFEALMRWRHPERGVLAPSEFLPVAEESGLIVRMGRWMLETVGLRLREWQRNEATRDLRISVNVSNRQFWHASLIDDLSECITANQLRPHTMDLEVTEGIIMHDVKLARKMLGELHDLGVGLYIDDFGTGYSSLEALHRLPIDVLKIDRSFVWSLGTDRRGDELVRAIVAMGTNLGLDLVAEGIENATQLGRLRSLGCHHGQGYLFSRAVPAEEADALASQAQSQYAYFS